MDGSSRPAHASPALGGSFGALGRDERLACQEGLLWFGELDERARRALEFAAELFGKRVPDQVEHPLSPLLRTFKFSMAIDSGHAAVVTV